MLFYILFEFLYIDKTTEGVYYYRLKQVDIDGQFSYSDILLIQINGRSDSQLFPNPSYIGQTTIIQVPLETTFDLTIFDSKGQLIRTYTGQTQQVKIIDLTSGLYIYHIQSEANYSQVGRFVILK